MSKVRRPPAYNPSSISRNKIRIPLYNEELPPSYEIVTSDRIPSAPPLIFNNNDIKKNISTQTEENLPKIRYTDRITLDKFTDEEKYNLLKFGRYLNVDILKYPFCLKYILACMNENLPLYWEEYKTDNGEIYFYNKKLDISTWTHPLDEYYRDLIKVKLKEYKKNHKSCSIM